MRFNMRTQGAVRDASVKLARGCELAARAGCSQAGELAIAGIFRALFTCCTS